MLPPLHLLKLFERLSGSLDLLWRLDFSFGSLLLLLHQSLLVLGHHLKGESSRLLTRVRTLLSSLMGRLWSLDVPALVLVLYTDDVRVARGQRLMHLAVVLRLIRSEVTIVD